MTNTIKSIALDKLIAHPDNPNRMSGANFAKLVRNIERTGRYEPLVVRPYPGKRGTRDDGRVSVSPCQESQCTSVFQIINGYHRWRALAKLGYKKADAIVWDIDDEQTDILLATLNRLGGSDELAKKLALLNRLNKRLGSGRLAKLLPQTKNQIERLANLKRPSTPAKIDARSFANPLVFFLTDKQQETVGSALKKVKSKKEEGQTKAARNAAALTHIAQYFLDHTIATQARNELAQYFETARAPCVQRK